MYDARLFNQAGEGLSSGFGDSNPYTKPLFNSGAHASMAYRPKRAAVEAEMNRGQLVDQALSFEKAGDGGDDPFGVGKVCCNGNFARVCVVIFFSCPLILTLFF